MTWLVAPVLVKLKRKPDVKIDYEHTEFKWIKPNEIDNYDIVPGADKDLRLVLELQ